MESRSSLAGQILQALGDLSVLASGDVPLPALTNLGTNQSHQSANRATRPTN